MSIFDLIKSKEQLVELASLMYDEIKNSNNYVVSRFSRLNRSGATFINGGKSDYNVSESNLNKELMDRGIYLSKGIGELLPQNFNYALVARDLKPHRFNLHHKGIELPTDQNIFYEDIPSNAEYFDEELRQFTALHQNTGINREFSVHQKIIVNSKGGLAIQSLPYFGISYSHGFDPLGVNRSIFALCNSNEKIKKFTSLIKYISDPTPDKRIKNSKTFSEAFHELYKISKLKYGSLEEAGIKLSGLCDVVILNGVPIHEVFGHQFEEPIRFLDSDFFGAFKLGQEIANKNVLMMDNPLQTIDDFRPVGFTYVDAYGRKRESRTHLKDGKVLNFLGAEYGDIEKFRSHFNINDKGFCSNASQSTDGCLPQARMSCTVIDGKTKNIDLENRVLIVPYAGETSPINKTYQVISNECYIIKNNEPLRIPPHFVTGGIYQALANMSLLPDLNYHMGQCGKSDPLYPQNSSNIPTSQFTRSQLWEQQQLLPVAIPHELIEILKS